jgi:hypothetical protein
MLEKIMKKSTPCIYNKKRGYYVNMINEYWVRPDESDKPKTAKSAESAC